MIRLRVDNSYSTILDSLDLDTLKKVNDACSFFVKGAQFSPQYQNRSWDGKRHLFSDSTYKFPTGLASKVTGLVGNIKVEDVRVKPVQKFNLGWAFPHKLRDYQEDAVEKSVKAQRGIIIVGTGGGKTVIGLKIFQELGVKSLFVVNTKEALLDTVRAAKTCFPKEKIGVYGGGKKNLGDFLTVTTMASITAAYKKGDNIFLNENYQALIIDEVHHVGADTWYKATMDINAFYKFGLTGTGFRSDNQSMLLQATTGRVICEVKAKDLQDGGYLSKSEITFVTIREPKSLDRPLNYQEAYLHGIMKNPYRNDAVVDVVKKHLGKSILIIIEKIRHGEILYETIKKVDPNAVLITGKSKNREDLKLQFESGEIRTVVASRIYQESVDIPILTVVVNAAGGKSGIKVIQQLGRSLRLADEKDTAYLYDFYDAFNYKLEEHSMERISWLKKEGHDVKIDGAEIDGAGNGMPEMRGGNSAYESVFGKEDAEEDRGVQ